MDKNLKFVSIGAGNVATHLVRGLKEKGYFPIQVYSRSEKSAQILAYSHNVQFTTSIREISPDADFYLVCIPDQVLPAFLSDFHVTGKLVIHTSGSQGIDVFGNKFLHCGVLYPVQTFSRDVQIDLSSIPFLVEGSDNWSLELIMKMAELISGIGIHMDSLSRRYVHLAAVFACNFTNHMYSAAFGILQEHGLDPSVLSPIIRETLRKAFLAGPVEAQTGPAMRNDLDTIQMHIKMLQNLPHFQKIYTFTSESIQHLKS